MSTLKLLLAGVVVLGLAMFSGTAQAAGSTRVFELRTYHCYPGKLDDLKKRFREHTMTIFARHGMTNVAYWDFQDEPDKSNTLIYLISHESREQAKKNWAEFSADPEWKKVAADSEVNGKLVQKVDSVFLDATDFSPMQ
jgi:hypothetical protein